MKTVNIREAKTHLSKLIDEAVNGEPFVITIAGKAMVKVEGIAAAQPKRIGFMEGEFEVPDDIDTMFQKEIEEMFYGPDGPPPLEDPKT